MASIKISSQNESLKGHGAIICTKSHFFDATLKPFKEPIIGTINLPEDDPETIKRVLCFLYRQNYNDHDQGAEELTSLTPRKCRASVKTRRANLNMARPLPTPISVYLEADKFSIVPLKQLALDNLSTGMKDYWMTYSFPKIAREIMSSISLRGSSLLNALVKVICGHLGDSMITVNLDLSLLQDWQKRA
ncbi:uncharacterized protein N7479_003390 [Penicillium vulpinum]|uniref:BTB domain-containing protein n=1 Tax=Penicillium vulpinum TaxID=29845 RepID=A0A1V6RE56_9EURO|nr:uncharacterized protein N7479_003390 [Penicillium vulpinum]KAJ5963514.1 hypothetical protein N7479_003390 [Penicillium vulpinum]OQE00082.1 hypothetical protein PENVUL_c059G00939 [Penicillium vulpinum]